MNTIVNQVSSARFDNKLLRKSLQYTGMQLRNYKAGSQTSSAGFSDYCSLKISQSLCFRVKFKPVKTSLSAGEISQQPALSYIPEYITYTLHYVNHDITAFIFLSTRSIFFRNCLRTLYLPQLSRLWESLNKFYNLESVLRVIKTVNKHAINMVGQYLNKMMKSEINALLSKSGLIRFFTTVRIFICSS